MTGVYCTEGKVVLVFRLSKLFLRRLLFKPLFSGGFITVLLGDRGDLLGDNLGDLLGYNLGDLFPLGEARGEIFPLTIETIVAP